MNSCQEYSTSDLWTMMWLAFIIVGQFWTIRALGKRVADPFGIDPVRPNLWTRLGGRLKNHRPRGE